MRRRKFLVGLGSLTAGTSVVAGTGALSESDIDRGVRGQVVADHGSGAYVKIEPGGKNGHFVEKDGGEVVLDFDSTGGGDGLNPDSDNHFDTVMNVRILNTDSGKSGGDYDMWITDSVGRLGWYKNGNPNLSVEGSSNARTMDQLPAGNAVPVGVRVNLDDSGLQAGDSINSLFTADDTFTIHVEASGGGSAPPST